MCITLLGPPKLDDTIYERFADRFKDSKDRRIKL